MQPKRSENEKIQTLKRLLTFRAATALGYPTRRTAGAVHVREVSDSLPNKLILQFRFHIPGLGLVLQMQDIANNFMNITVRCPVSFAELVIISLLIRLRREAAKDWMSNVYVFVSILTRGF